MGPESDVVSDSYVFLSNDSGAGGGAGSADGAGAGDGSDIGNGSGSDDDSDSGTDNESNTSEVVDPETSCENGVHAWVEDSEPLDEDTKCCYDDSHSAEREGRDAYYYCIECGLYSCSDCH